MPFALILVGAILIVVAFQNTMGQLATELQADIPGFFIWAVAIAAILGLGYIPGLKTPSRWLLGLVVLVIVLTQYKAILSGFTDFASTGAQATNKGASAPDPATVFASSPKGPLPTAASVGGDAGGGPGAAAAGGGIAGGIAGGILGGLGGLGGGDGSIMNLAGGGGFDPMAMMGGGFGGMADAGGFGGGFGGMDMSSVSSLAMLALL